MGDTNEPRPDLKKDVKVVLIGAGGVGTVAALVLSKSGRAHVTIVLRSQYDIIQSQGWDIDSVDHGNLKGWKSDCIVKNVEDAVYAESSLPSEQKHKIVYDYVVLCTKQLPNIAPTPPLIAPLITPNRTTIVLIQNGIAIEEPLIAAFPSTPILSAVSMIGSFTLPPNRVSQIGHDIVQMGAHYHPGVPESISSTSLHRFVSIYQAGGAADCTIAPDMRKARWAKILWNASFNTLCALLEMTVGQLQRSGAKDTLVLPIMREICSIAEKDGAFLEESLVQHMLHRSSDSSTYQPSMLLDREAGRPMEIESILGNAIKKGKEFGVECPIMSNVYELLKVVEWKNQDVGK